MIHRISRLILLGVTALLIAGCGAAGTGQTAGDARLSSSDQDTQASRPIDDAKKPGEPVEARPKQKMGKKKKQAEGSIDAGLREQLEAVGYLQESDVAVAETKIPIYDKTKAYNSLNVYNSAHAAEAYVMDMDGNILHTWSCPFDSVWPGFETPPHVREQFRSHFRRVHLFDNGDLLAIFENVGLVKMDVHSNLIWKYMGNCHHDAAVTEEGDIYVLANAVTYTQDAPKPVWVLDPTIAVLNSDGTEREIIFVREYLRNSPYAAVLEDCSEIGDILHNNTIQVFDGKLAEKSELFRKGNILISSRKMDFVAILNPDKKSVVWMIRSMFRGQHESTLLDTGTILLFDNRGLGERSQALEFDPFSQKVVWSYSGGDDAPFYSAWCSTVQRLPNGNTLVTSTNEAEAFEVTREGEVVWRFENQDSVGNRQNAANLFDVYRLPADFSPAWIGTKVAAMSTE